MAAAASFIELPPLTTLTLVRDDVADSLGEAELLVEQGRHDEAVERLEDLWSDVRGDAPLALRQRLALAWSEMYRGDLERCSSSSSTPSIVALAALRRRRPRRASLPPRLRRAQAGRDRRCDLALHPRTRPQRAGPSPSALLAANTYEWRSRCHQFRRDWDAAARDAERSLELATSAGDEPAQAHALFQASAIAERRKDWLVARYYAGARARALPQARRRALHRTHPEQPRRHQLPAR